MDHSFSLPLSDSSLFTSSELSTQSTSLLCTQVQRHVLLLGVQLLESVTLALVDDCQDTGNALPHTANLANLVGSTSCNLLDAQSQKLLLQLVQLFSELSLGKISEFESFGGALKDGWMDELEER